jgi:hypothetical protein
LIDKQKKKREKVAKYCMHVIYTVMVRIWIGFDCSRLKTQQGFALYKRTYIGSILPGDQKCYFGEEKLKKIQSHPNHQRYSSHRVNPDHPSNQDSKENYI